MARDATVRTVLTANDQASGPIKQFQAALGGLKGEMSGVNDMTGLLTGGLAGIAAGIGLSAISDLANQIGELGRQGEQALILKDSFATTAAGVGESSNAMLTSLRGASQGMIADQDLILAANRAMMLGVADSSAEMAQLLEVAAVRGRAMGLSTSQAFNDLVTGLGRMSPLILDNLGIVTGGEKVFEEYAASINKTAASLTDAERKQALFNRVVASTDTSVTPLVSQFERMDAAIANAKTALGELFSPAVAAIAQQLADSVNAALETTEQPAAMTALANLRKELQDATTEWLNLKHAQQEVSDLPFASGKNIGFAEGRLPSDGPAPEMPAPDTSKMDAAKKKMDEMGKSVQELEDRIKLYASGMSELDPKLDRVNEKQAAAASSGRFFAQVEQMVADNAAIMQGAVTRAGAAVDQIRGQFIQAAAAGMGAAQAFAEFNKFKGLEDQAKQIQAGLGNLGFYEPEQIQFEIDVNTAQAKKQADDLIGSFNEVESTIESIASITPGLLNNMGLDEAIKWQAEQEASLRAQAEHLRQIGYTDEQISLALRGNVAETQAWATSLDKVSSVTSDIEKAMGDLQGRALSAVQEATQLDVGVNPDDFLPREDAVNENARRLAAIMRDGITNQPWLEEFKNEVPAVFNELVNSGDPKAAAAKIMQDFQAGLRPELLDLGAIKEQIKNEIAGEAAMQATAAQITAELVNDTGGDSADIQAKVAKALGLGVDQADVTGGILGDLNSATFNSQLATAATGAGKGWGNTFLATVGNNVPGELVNLLVNLVTPGVQANLNQAQSQSAPVGSIFDLHH